MVKYLTLAHCILPIGGQYYLEWQSATDIKLLWVKIDYVLDLSIKVRAQH